MKLNLVDLAGSEKINQSKVEGAQKCEALSINKSLTALQDVIAALNQNEQHIPYRNSKLTHLLKPFMSGEAKVVMIVNVTALEDHINESLSSLSFAKKVNATRLLVEEKENQKIEWSSFPASKLKT